MRWLYYCIRGVGGWLTIIFNVYMFILINIWIRFTIEWVIYIQNIYIMHIFNKLRDAHLVRREYELELSIGSHGWWCTRTPTFRLNAHNKGGVHLFCLLNYEYIGLTVSIFKYNKKKLSTHENIKKSFIIKISKWIYYWCFTTK